MLRDGRGDRVESAPSHRPATLKDCVRLLAQNPEPRAPGRRDGRPPEAPWGPGGPSIPGARPSWPGLGMDSTGVQVPRA